MLQSIRDNSQSIVAKIIVGLIIVTFALFGVESLVSLTAGSDAPATVNGEEITQQEFYQATELQRRQLLSQMGENADPTLLDENLIQNMVLDSLIEQKTLLLAAQDQGLLISDRMIDQMIVSTPDFQLDGKFSAEQFEAVLRNVGLTPLMYRDLMRKERLIQQTKNAIEFSAFSTSGAVEQLVALDRQTRSFSYFPLSLEQAKQSVNVTDAEVAARYEEQKDSLLTDEQVVIEYILLDKLALRDTISVSEDDLRAQYDQLLASFKAEEQRPVAHILVEINGDVDEAAALAKANDLKAQLDAGVDFAELAKAESDDIGSAASGGDLGVNGKGVFVSEFEDAMFALDAGAISEPVKTEFGYHVIKVGELSEKTPPTFAEAKFDLTDEATDNKVEALYVEKLEQLADVSFSSGDLIEPSEVLDIAIETAAPFSRNGGDNAVTENKRVIDAAFSAELIQDGVNSAPIELDSDRTVVIRVKEHQPPRPQALEEVAQLLKETLQTEKAAAVLKEQADAAVAALQEGSDINTVAAGRAVSNEENVSRTASEIDPALLQQVFAMAKPVAGKATTGTAELSDGSLAVVSLTGVTVPTAEISADEQRFIEGFLQSRVGQQEYQGAVEVLKDAAVVEKL
ncbi:SurA N-terminal domain-containing protein [Neptunomonas marina]|uniref:Periplasmic chaperone PpiD n=1 Tax=Neptunomonas marina TaxID=1815562 RepID=A0A437QDP6_9GAMM|nr:SurA N-terminal domain-containing protein [Neptunomonas marina]RVU32654.1 peptidylprolyl isomerase [Neptunomonas marina]